MYTYIWRATRQRLTLTGAAIVASSVALAACADDERPFTAPSAAHADRASLGPGTVITVTNTRGTREVGSLRWAISQTTGGEIIRFDPRLAGGTILLDSTIYITHPLTIEADSVRGMTLNGGNARRVIDVFSIAKGLVTLRNLTITGGRLLEGGGGAGIRSNIALKVEHSTIHGNSAVAAPAILALGPLMLYNSTVSNNTSTGYLYHAISVADKATVENSTIAFNSQGGIDFSEYYGGSMYNSIVVNNGGYLNNCGDAELLYIGNNIASDLTCGEPPDVTIGDPGLGPLANNGGPTPTHSVTRQSIAFNAYTVATGCENLVDQRYKRRDTYCDIGSFEVDPTKVTITIDPNVKVNAATGVAVLTGTVTCVRDETFQLALELHQQQKAGRLVVDVHAADTPQVTCGTTPTAWAQQMVLTDGAWQSGSAQATAQTYQTPSWLLPASVTSQVKIAISRK